MVASGAFWLSYWTLRTKTYIRLLGIDKQICLIPWKRIGGQQIIKINPRMSFLTILTNVLSNSSLTCPNWQVYCTISFMHLNKKYRITNEKQKRAMLEVMIERPPRLSKGDWAAALMGVNCTVFSCGLKGQQMERISCKINSIYFITYI